ncbi:MAG: endolytic transglycosylase MltG [Nocardioides sp.]
MTEQYVEADAPAPDPYDEGGRRKRERSRLPGCLAALLALAVLAGGLWLGITKGVDLLTSRLASPGDYPGPGHGKVLFEVHEGDTSAAIGRNLKSDGVVKSVDAFTEAAAAEPKALGIQVGFYQLQKQMPAADALDILIDPANLVNTAVTIPEGMRVTDVLDRLAEQTDFARKDYEKVLANPKRLGLPAYAGGNPEGYLFPSTYDVTPKSTPYTILKAMVDRRRQAAADVDLEGAAERLGYTPHELMTIASLVEAEARGKDMPKVARVIYNRLENPGTNGRSAGWRSTPPSTTRSAQPGRR